MGEFDVKPKGLERLPTKDIKELARKNMGGVKDKTPPEVNYSWSDVMNILKHQLRKYLLIALGKEKSSVGDWIILLVIILSILALTVAVMFPKLGIL